MARKPRQAKTAKEAEAPVQMENVSRPLPVPTYPLTPNEIEVILHIHWDGKAFTESERSGKKAVTLKGEDLLSHAQGLPFNPDYNDPKGRVIEYSITNQEDFEAILPRAHRVQLVTKNGKLPEILSGNDWNAGKKGVSKSDGYGILLTRPIA